MRMSVHAINKAELARDSHTLRQQAMSPASRRGDLLVGASFLVAAVALLLIGGSDRSFSPATAVLYVLLIALAMQIRFDVGAGFTVPTQAVFVPMLFAIPAAVIPLLVPLALALGMVP